MPEQQAGGADSPRSAKSEAPLAVCPKCASSLVVRTNSETHHEFLGCSQYPECKHTEELPAYVKMKRAGAPMLDLFGDSTGA